MTDDRDTAESTAGERLLRWHDPREVRDRVAASDGLTALRAMRDGTVPPPPMAVLMNMSIRTVEPGSVEFACVPGPEHYNPLGVVHGGFACTVLDTVIGCAGHTTLPAGQGYTSIDLAITYLRPILSENGRLIATGTVIKPGRRVIFAEGTLADGTGTVLARASSSLLVLAG